VAKNLSTAKFAFFVFVGGVILFCGATYEEHHSLLTSLRLGMVLFIVSEIMFFSPFFGLFFFIQFSTVFSIDGVWPQKQV
jgi:heme/copper-type cytochrome/quinol oxidase subunit 3